MNFGAVSLDNAFEHYRKHHGEAFSRIMAKQDKTFIKQVVSIVNAINTSFVKQLDEILLKQPDLIVNTTNKRLSESNDYERTLMALQKEEEEKKNIIYYPPEIISNILDHVEAKDLFPVAQSCRHMANIIHDIVGYKNVYIKRYTDILKIQQYKGIMNNSIVQLDHMRDTTLFSLLAGCRKLKRSPKNKLVNDGDLKAIANVRQPTFIDLSECNNVTDEGIRALKGARTVNLYGCNEVTDKGIKALSGVHEIDLSGCHKVTDEGVRALAGVHTIYIRNSPNITDEGVKSLAGVYTIMLNGCTSITDAGIKALAGVHNIFLFGIPAVTDESIKALAGVHTVALDGFERITDEGFKALKGVHTISIRQTNITDEGIKALAGAHTVNLSQCNVSEKGIKALAGVHEINLTDFHITQAGFKALISS